MGRGKSVWAREEMCPLGAAPTASQRAADGAAWPLTARVATHKFPIAVTAPSFYGSDSRENCIRGKKSIQPRQKKSEEFYGRRHVSKC
jgi:hypothetical protein